MKKSLKVLSLMTIFVISLFACYKIFAENIEINIYENGGNLTSAAVEYSVPSERDTEQGKLMSLRLEINANTGKRLAAVSYREANTGEYNLIELNEQTYLNYKSIDNGYFFEINDIKAVDTDINLIFEDYESVDITYANFIGGEHDDIYDLSNYSDTYTNLVSNYRGGDIVLPNDCLENGCTLKVAFTSNAAYQSMQERVHNYNEISNEFDKIGEPLTIINEAESEHPYMFFNVERSFTEKNIQGFDIGDNKNHLLGEDFVGLKLTTNIENFNDNYIEGCISFTGDDLIARSQAFYGSKEIYVEPCPIRNVVGTEENTGALKKSFNKIASADNRYSFQWDNNEKKAIVRPHSYFEQEYNIALRLKNNDTDVATVALVLERFAFAGGIVLVDGENEYCGHENNESCDYATEYRGIPSVFYTLEQDPIQLNSNFFSWGYDHNTLVAKMEPSEQMVYEANRDFHPWAIAIYYHDDEIVETRSFDLGEIVQEGIVEVPHNEESYAKPGADMINGVAHTVDNFDTLMTGYNPEDYTLFDTNLAKIKDIKYYTRAGYNGTIMHFIHLINKTEAQEKGINRISLFLANGEMKSDNNTYPALTYGVGKGVEFDVRY